jgi:hypothetical protein
MQRVSLDNPSLGRVIYILVLRRLPCAMLYDRLYIVVVVEVEIAGYRYWPFSFFFLLLLECINLISILFSF